MAGHGVEDDPKLKGFTRLFNSQTNRGRANVSSDHDNLALRYLEKLEKKCKHKYTVGNS